MTEDVLFHEDRGLGWITLNRPKAINALDHGMVRAMTEDVLFRRDRGLGWITLNRPKAINALDHGMVRAIDAQLATWTEDDRVGGVVITGAGERGLCAGGDVLAFYRDGRTGSRYSVDFWRDEYALNARIAEYPKPYLAIMEGIVMGGGVGISAHGSIRVVTERSRIAMPETGIGFCPDVGGNWLLGRAPGELGTHAALTGATVTGADAIVLGLADHYLPAADLAEFLAGLSAETITASNWSAPPTSELEAERVWIDACYGADTVSDIVGRLRDRPESRAREAAERILANSPVAVSVALRALRSAREMPTLRDVLDQDLRVSTAALDSHDLVEGIRAQLVDKDRAPVWSPSTLADVTSEMVDRYFAGLSEAGACR